MSSNRGFTIVELLVVVVVIAILAAITVVAYNGIQAQARSAVLKNDAQTAATFMETAKGKGSAYPTTLDGAGENLKTTADRVTGFYSTGSTYCISMRSTRTNAQFYVTDSQNSPQEGLCPADMGAQVAPFIGAGTGGTLGSPAGLTVGPSGVLYFTDGATSRIRGSTEAGVITNLAGNFSTGTTDGVGTAALFNWPQGATVGFNGDLYIADTNNSRIRLVPVNGSTSTATFAGPTGIVATGATNGTGTAARFNQPRGIAYDAANNRLIVADTVNHMIRQIDASGTVSALAGASGGGNFDNTNPTLARFNSPNAVAIGPDGTIYVADSNNHKIRKVSPAGVVTTLAGSTAGLTDGVGAAAQFNFPRGLTVSNSGVVYVADTSNHTIRKILPDGTVSTLAGNGSSGYAEGIGDEARFNEPRGVILLNNKLYVVDTLNQRIRVLTNI